MTRPEVEAVDSVGVVVESEWVPADDALPEVVSVIVDVAVELVVDEEGEDDDEDGDEDEDEALFEAEADAEDWPPDAEAELEPEVALEADDEADEADEVDVDADADPIGLGAPVSWLPELPTGRANALPLSWSTTTITTTGVGAGWTTTTLFGWNEGQALPVKVGVALDMTGGSSGFPHAQRVRGTPRLSTSTAVPACSTDWKLVAAPSANPWLVTRVSTRSTTGVSECR
nr:hypothetical protein [Kitasatospora mediocidica]